MSQTSCTADVGRGGRRGFTLIYWHFIMSWGEEWESSGQEQKLARASGVPVSQRSSSQLAMTLVATINNIIVKLHSELAHPTELQLDGGGVDFVFPPSKLTRITTTSNKPHQNLLEGFVLHTWYLVHRLNSQTPMDGHLPCLGWSPTNPMMVTHQKEVHYRHGIWYFDLTHKTKTRWQLPGIVTYHP